MAFAFQEIIFEDTLITKKCFKNYLSDKLEKYMTGGHQVDQEGSG